MVVVVAVAVVVIVVVVVVRRLSFVVVVVAAAAAVATCCCCSTSAQSLAGTSFSQEDGSKPRACQYVFASPAGVLRRETPPPLRRKRSF